MYSHSEIKNRYSQTLQDAAFKDAYEARQFPDDALEPGAGYRRLKENTSAERATEADIKNQIRDPQSAKAFSDKYLDPCLKKPRRHKASKPPDAERLNAAALRTKAMQDREAHGRKHPAGPEDPYSDADVGHRADGWVRNCCDSIAHCFSGTLLGFERYFYLTMVIFGGLIGLQVLNLFLGGRISAQLAKWGAVSDTAQGLVCAPFGMLIFGLVLAAVLIMWDKTIGRQKALAIGLKAALEADSETIAGELGRREDYLLKCATYAMSQKEAVKSDTWFLSRPKDWPALRSVWERTIRFFKDRWESIGKMQAIRQASVLASFRATRDAAHFQLRCYPIGHPLADVDKSVVRMAVWALVLTVSGGLLCFDLLTATAFIPRLIAILIFVIQASAVIIGANCCRHLGEGIETRVTPEMLVRIVDLAEPKTEPGRDFDAVAVEAETAEAVQRLSGEARAVTPAPVTL